MKKISIWAFLHKWPARIIIIVAHFVLIAIALFLGDLIKTSGIRIPSEVIYGLAGLFILLFITYPVKNDKPKYRNFYKSRKTADFALVSISFLLLLSFGNHYHLDKNRSPFHFNHAYATELNPGKTPLEARTIEPSPKKKSSFFTNWKKKLKENIRTIRREYKDATPAERTALIILAVVAALALLYLVAALACNLSCAGSDGAAIVVAVLGTALIIFLLVRVIKRIKRGKPKPVSEPATG